MIELLTSEIYEGMFDSGSAPADSPASNNDANTVPADANAAPADANAAPADASPDAKYDPIKKYVLYNKLKSLGQNLSQFQNMTPDMDLRSRISPIVYTIDVILKFFDLFDYDTIKKISNDVVSNTEAAMKHAKTKKQSTKEEALHAEL